jgi:proteasome alpha subunit
MGDVFTREPKPLEVEVIVAEVGEASLLGHESNEIYRISFDGSISDHEGWCVIGGTADDLSSHLQSNFQSNSPLGEVLRLGRATLQQGADGGAAVEPENLEVCLLEKARTGRKFRRLNTEELTQHLSG